MNYFNFIIITFIIIVLFYGFKINSKFEIVNNYFSVERTNHLRGILAVVIIVDHISGVALPNDIFLKPFHTFGFLAVAVFFFLSGYGLAYQTKHKKNYINIFLPNRLISILIPLFVTNLLNLIILIGYNNIRVNNIYEIFFYIFDFLGIYVINGPSWFLKTLFIFYVLYYLTNKYLKKHSDLFMFICILILTVIRAVNLDSGTGQDFGMCFSFLIGIIWLKKEDMFIAMANKNYFKYLLIVFILTFVFLLTYLLMYENLIIGKIIARNIGTSLFSILFIMIFSRIQIGNKVTTFLGNISTELYLLHFSIISVIINEVNILHDSSIYIIIVIFCTLALAICINRIDIFLIKSLKRVIYEK